MKLATPRAFLIAFFIGILTAPVGLVMFNVAIDPFRVFNSPDITGVNAQRLYVSSQGRMAKANRVCVAPPVSVVMGTSRVEVGVNPVHPGWSYPGRQYSLALAGIGISELEMTFRHLVNASPDLKEVAIGIDFLMFNAHRENVVFGTEVFGFERDRLLLEEGDTCWDTFLHDAVGVLGPPAAKFSILTLQNQMAGPESGQFELKNLGSWIAQYDPNGYRGGYFSAILQSIKISGFRGVIDGAGRAAGQERGYVSKVWRPLPTQRFCMTAPSQEPTISTFQKMAALAHERDIRVHFFINPIHARMLLAIHQMGIWPIYEDWKRQLVAANEDAANNVGKTPLPIWDFSGFNTVTTEAIPESGDVETEMQYWWEPSHYRAAAGIHILDRILDHLDAARPIPADFGVRLSPDTIEANIQDTRNGLSTYTQNFPIEASIVTDVVNKVLDTSDGSNCGHDIAAAKAGSILLNAGDLDAAEAAFNKALRLHSEAEATYAAIGAPFRETAFEKVLEQARTGARLNELLSSWREHNQRGTRRVAEGDLAGALLDFDVVLSLAPPMAVLYQTRGSVRLQVGDLSGAMDDFKAGLALEPENTTIPVYVTALRNRLDVQVVPPAQEAIRAGDYAKAISLLENALDILPDQDEYQALLTEAKAKYETNASADAAAAPAATDNP